MPQEPLVNLHLALVAILPIRIEGDRPILTGRLVVHHDDFTGPVYPEIVNRAKDERITAGKDPTGLAAAAIYIAGVIEGERRTQRAIAEAAHVTEVTVRNRYKELVRRLGLRVQL